MSLKAIWDSVEAARSTNANLGTSFEGKLNTLHGELTRASEQFQETVTGICGQIDKLKADVAGEIAERDRDLLRLLEGAA